MADIYLQSLSLQELRALRKEVDRAIASFEARKKAEARAALDAGIGYYDTAPHYGFGRAELHTHLAAAHGQHGGGPVAAAAVEEPQHVARLHTPHLRMARGTGRQRQKPPKTAKTHKTLNGNMAFLPTKYIQHRSP